MATRADILRAFYDELTTAAVGDFTVTRADNSTETFTVNADDVSLEFPETVADPVDVVYGHTWSEIPYNGVGRGPDTVTLNADGSVQDIRHRDYRRGDFLIAIAADDALLREEIYEAIYRHFDVYDSRHERASSIHEDLFDINVMTGEPSSLQREQTVRVSELTVQLDFVREYVTDDGTLDEVETTAEGDNYTTT